MRRSWIATALVCAFANPAWAGAATDPTSFEAGRAALERVRGGARPEHARNVILFLGDGMGVSTVTAARIFAGQQRGEPGEENELAFEKFPHVALLKTYNTDQQTPDSAGTMTALVTGAKTRAGVLSVDRSLRRGDFANLPGNELRTIVEQAEERGLATGFVTTTTVTHATPGALYAHSPERGWESDGRLPPAARAAGFADVARQLAEFGAGDGIDVALGGGRQNFLPRGAPDPGSPTAKGQRLDGRDLTAEWVDRRANAAFVWNRKQLLGVDVAATDHLLGLFHSSHMSFDLDRGGDDASEPSLSEMTAVAISLLEKNAKGFFLMVEGGRIDHAHHAGNAYRALHETVEFANAVEVALAATDRGDTLIVVTADHSHVFTIAGYATRGNDILGKVAPNDSTGKPAKDLSRDAKGRPYTTLGYQNGPGASNSVLTGTTDRAHHGAEGLGERGEDHGRPDLTGVDTADTDFLQEAAVPLASETHAGEDVAAYAIGPGAYLFRGVQEQHYVYHAMVESLGWNQRSSLSRLLP